MSTSPETACTFNCATCNDLNPMPLFGWGKKTNARAIARSAKDGCPWCLMVWNGVMAFVTPGFRNNNKIGLENTDRRGFDFNLPKDITEALHIYTFQGFRWTHLEIEYYVPEGLTPPHSSLTNRRHLAEHSSSEKSFDLVRSWISDCSKTHELCKAPSTRAGFIPTRLIDVANSLVRLCETREGDLFTGSDVRYVALSHCWGQQRFYTTTPQNLGQNKIEIKWGLLTKTFQDAVEITRRLGLRFLWIDSLCIVQDEHDKEDWKREAPQMMSVYSEAFVTLAATHSADGTGGCFSQRGPGERVVWSSSDGKTQVFARPYIDHRTPDLVDYREPLLRRAWTLQEHLLSRRIIHYSRKEIIFECRTGTACECSLHFRPNRNRLRRRLDFQSTLMDIAAPLAVSPNGLFDLWNRLVEEYSNRHLTHVTDKIEATRGLQKYFFQVQEEHIREIQKTVQRVEPGNMLFNYLMARSRAFIVSLLWSVDYSVFRTNHRRPEHGAPSWSWASIDGPITFGYITIGTGVELSFKPLPPFEALFSSQFMTGTVNLNAPAVHAQVQVGVGMKYLQSANSHRDMEGKPLQNVIGLVGLLKRNDIKTPFNPDEAVLSNAPVSLARHWVSRSPWWNMITSLEDVLCVKILDNVEFSKSLRLKNGEADNNYFDSEQSKKGAVGLIVKPSQQAANAYQRIGIACFPEDKRWFDGAQATDITLI